MPIHPGIMPIHPWVKNNLSGDVLQNQMIQINIFLKLQYAPAIRLG